MKVTELIQDGKNANKGTKRGRELVAESLKRFGAGRSVLIDRDGRLIAGNKTAAQASDAGITEVIVVKTDGRQLVAVQRTDLTLDDQTAQGLAIADNRVGELGLEWDADVLGDLVGVGDLDLEPFFTADELAATLGLDREAQESDDAPAVPKVAQTRPGDLYVLGTHRLLCGDSTSITDVERLMAGAKADMVFTDPPYNIGYEGGSKKRDMIKNDQVADFYKFLLDVYSSAFAVMRPGASIYVTHAETERANFTQAFVDAGFHLSSVIIWAKNNSTFGRQDYFWKHEPMLYGWHSGGAHEWLGPNTEDTVWQIDRPSRSEEHPTMKPVQLIERALSNSSRAGYKVLDLFGGSGSTLIACENLKRNAYLMELDPLYCDVIVTRWELATGRNAELFTKD